MTVIAALIAGLIFGLGLIISGMTNPAKVIGFLDFAGQWNYSLVFVMLGAISVSFFAFLFTKSHPKTLTGQAIMLSNNRKIDARLVLGSTSFGIGWGLAGYCPGPAVASLVTGIKSIIFVIAMLLGMALYEFLQNILHTKNSE